MAGQKANLIIANPSGIQASGADFINVHEATLSTGRLTHHLGDIRHEVTQGVISIEASNDSTKGLGNTHRSDFVNLYSQAASINAQVQANHAITAVVGSNVVYDDGRTSPIATPKTTSSKPNTTPTIALDVKALGGMSAGSITLIGTDKGLGVNQAGNLTAKHGIAISADGKIKHTGQSITQLGLVQLNSKASIELGDTPTNQAASIQANQGIKLDANQITSQHATISTQGNILLTAKQDLGVNSGTLTAGGNIQAVVTGDGMAGNHQTSAAFKDSHLTAKGNITTANIDGNLTHRGSAMNATGNISSFAKHKQTLDNTTLNSEKNTQIQANHDLTINNTSINTKQHTAIYTKGNQTTNNSLINTQGVLSNITDGNHTILGQVKHTGGAVLLQSNELLVQDDAKLTARATGSALLADNPSTKHLDGDLSIQTNQTLTLSPHNHAIHAAKDLSLRAIQGDLNLQEQSGNKGNGSQQELHLNALGGGIELQGQNIHLQGSQLHAAKDIGLYATQGHVVINGIKNTLTNRQAVNALQHTKKQFDDTQAQLTALKKLPEYTAYQQEKARLQHLLAQHQKYLDYLEDLEDSNPTKPPSLPNIPPRAEPPPPPPMPPSGRPYTMLIGINTYAAPRAMSSTVSTRFNHGFPPEVVNFKADEAFGRLNQTYKDLIVKETSLTKHQDRLQSRMGFLNQAVTGYEHSTSLLNSNQGDITLAARQGILLSGANLQAKAGNISLSALGVMPNTYTQSTKSENTQTLNSSILLDGLQHYYEIGRENSDYHRILAFSTPTTLTAGKDIHLNATHQHSDAHLIVQGGQLTADKDIRLNANHHILLDTDLDYEYGYDRSTRRHGSWYKRKYTTTISTNEWQDAVPTLLTANNIHLKTHGLTHKNNLTLYGTRMHTTGGDISLWSSGNIALYAVDNLHSNEYNSHTKKRLLGIRYNDTHTQGSRHLKTALPATLTANYIGSHSQGDTTLEGTQFNYLSGASITAGGRLSLLPAINILQERHQQDSNSVVWQSLSDQGQVQETAALPSFTGISQPTLHATGGISVQIPLSEKDTQKQELKAQILQLATQPEYSYLAELSHRDDIDWQKIILSQEEWNYKQQGLTPAGAAIVTIALSIATGDVSGSIATAATTAFQSQTIGAMASAAFSSLTTKATISLINNQGDIKATLRELGSNESVKQLATSVITAGLLSKFEVENWVSNFDDTKLDHRIIKNLVDGTARALVETGIQGGSLKDNLENALLNGLTTAVHGELAEHIKGLEDGNYLLHKIAHAAAGCAAHAIQKQCEAGAIGAAVGEVVASLIPTTNYFHLDDEQQKIQIYGQLISATISSYAGYDPTIASQSAQTAIENNSLKLLSSTGKVLVKVYQGYRKLGKKATANDIVQLLKKQGADELVGMAVDLYTIFGKGHSSTDRLIAAIDLVIGSDFNNKGKAEVAKKSAEIARIFQQKGGYTITIQTIKNTDFSKLNYRQIQVIFDNISPAEFAQIWSNPQAKAKIISVLRKPSGYHEWMMVSKADKFQKWGVKVDDIWSYRTRIKNLTWTVPNGLANAGQKGWHGGKGSGAFHHELGQLIDNSKNLQEFRAGLIRLGQRWSIPNIPLPK